MIIYKVIKRMEKSLYTYKVRQRMMIERKRAVGKELI